MNADTPTQDELRKDLPRLNRMVALLEDWEIEMRHPTRYGKPDPWTIPYCRHAKHTCGRWKKGTPRINHRAYPSSADACRTFEDAMSDEEFGRYLEVLLKMSRYDPEYLLKLKPVDRCIARLIVAGRIK